MTETRIGAAIERTISGMDCVSCAAKIKDAVTRLPGVTGVEVSLVSERLRLTLDEGQTTRDRVEEVVTSLGQDIGPRAAAKKAFVLPGGAGGHRSRRP